MENIFKGNFYKGFSCHYIVQKLSDITFSFVYGLLTEADNRLYSMAWHEWMLSLHNLRFYHVICLEKPRKTHKLQDVWLQGWDLNWVGGRIGVWCDCCLRAYEEYLKLNHAMSTKHKETYSRKQAISSFQYQ